MALDFKLSGLNKPQDIGRPAKVKNTLPGGVYGQFATGFVSGLGRSVGVKADDLQLDVPTTNSHLKAERAVADNRKVVILFQNPKGSMTRPSQGRSGRSTVARRPWWYSPMTCATRTVTGQWWRISASTRHRRSW